MKKLLFTLAALCSFAVSAKAQHYNEILLFIEVGKTIDDVSEIKYLHFDSDGNMYIETMYKSTAQNKYAKGVLEEYGVNRRHDIKRDYSIDSSKYKVYSREYSESSFDSSVFNVPSLMGFNVCAPLPRTRKYIYYYGIEYGGASLVQWHTFNDSDEVLSKKYYKRIQPSDLARKAPNYDFLN